MESLENITIACEIETLRHTAKSLQREIDLAIIRKAEIDQKLNVAELNFNGNAGIDFTRHQSRGFVFEHEGYKIGDSLCIYYMEIENYPTAELMAAELKRIFTIEDIEDLIIVNCWGLDVQSMEFFSVGQCLIAGEEYYVKYKD